MSLLNITGEELENIEDFRVQQYNESFNTLVAENPDYSRFLTLTGLTEDDEVLHHSYDRIIDGNEIPADLDGVYTDCEGNIVTFFCPVNNCEISTDSDEFYDVYGEMLNDFSVEVETNFVHPLIGRYA